MHAPAFITDGPPRHHQGPLYHTHDPRALHLPPIPPYDGLGPPPTPPSYLQHAMNHQIREPYSAYAFATPSPGALLQFAAHEQASLAPHFSQQLTHSAPYHLTPSNVPPIAMGLENNMGIPVSWSAAGRGLPAVNIQEGSFSRLGGIPFQTGRHDFLTSGNAFASHGIHSRLRHKSDMVSQSQLIRSSVYNLRRFPAVDAFRE